MPAVPARCYSRLCPAVGGDWPPHDERDLAILSALMRDDEAKRARRAGSMPRDQVMRSGYVYLAQFIAHDISRDLDPLAEAHPDVAHTCNYRTPRLDLELLYGLSPEETPFLYDSDHRLKLGMTESVAGMAATANDLPREADGEPLLIDSRSDDNLIVAQIHVLLAKFHNRVCDLLEEQPELSVGPVGASLLEQARRFVVWHYQWIIWHDFLPLLVQRKTLRAISQGEFHLFARSYTPTDAPAALPVEFTLAAFRYGHALVRPDYFLNPAVRVVPAAELVRMTQRGGGIKRQLPANYVVSWPRFFTGGNATVNRGESIDTYITSALYDLPALAPAPAGPLGAPLPEMTLKRGSRVRLPSGQDLGRRFGFPELAPNLIAPSPEEDAFFRDSGFHERTPLWYYLLREAAVEGIYEPEPDGRHLVQKLGTAGGRIVAETFSQLLRADSDSIWNAGRSWQPPTFILGRSETPYTLQSMNALVRFTESV